MTAPDIAQIPMSAELSATLARGAEFAGATGAGEISLEHLLAALCDDPDALAVLDASHLSGERIKADVISRVLGASQPGPPQQEPMDVSVEVRRILEAASAASRGSRRRDINGAIVLAAIVGDARSVAAEILEAHGLTFENAIRALQAALTPPREQPRPQPPIADDVLARARERVQSRSAPSLRDIMKDMPRPAPLGPVTQGHDPAPLSAPSSEPSFPEAPHTEHLPAQAAGSLPEIVPPPEAEHPRAEPSLPPEAVPTPAPSNPFSMSPPQPEPEFTAVENARDEYPGLSFGAPGQAPAAPATGLGQSSPAFPQEPFLPLPSRPVSQPDSGPPPPEENPLSLPFPSAGQSPAGAPQQRPQHGPQSFGSSVPPPREIFADLPPRPQPRSQPPPIPPGGPAPGLGGPATARGRPASGPMPSPGAPTFGPPGPSLSPNGPTGAPIGPAAGAPRPRPNLGQESGFRLPQPGLQEGPQIGPAPIGPGPITPGVPHAPAQQPQAQRRAPKRSKAANVETGQLAENIPRAMRVGKTVRAEIRIAKASIRALTASTDAGGQGWQQNVAQAKAVSVRLRAPDGDFYVEPASPETQWVESNVTYSSDDFASWRFLITPKSRGWADLQIIVSARSIGADGGAAETALPDQIVEVKVRRNFGRAIGRLIGWAIAAVIGGALVAYGEPVLLIVKPLLKKAGH